MNVKCTKFKLSTPGAGYATARQFSGGNGTYPVLVDQGTLCGVLLCFLLNWWDEGVDTVELRCELAQEALRALRARLRLI